MSSEYLTLIVAGLGICGSLGGVILGQRLSRKLQREQWLLDRRAEEFRELLDALAASLRAAQITSPQFGPPFTVIEPEQQKSIIEIQAQTMRVIRSRVFVAEDVASLQIENRWGAAVMKHNDTKDMFKLGGIYDDIRSEIVRAAKTSKAVKKQMLIGVPLQKLNGWKRIGIITSIIWILGAGVGTYRSDMENASGAVAAAHVDCDSRLAGKSEADWKVGFDRCNKQADEAVKRETENAQLVGALVGLVPVSLGWALAYLALFLVRWVKLGFPQAR